MKVALISPPYGKWGGPELTTIQLADALTDLGVDVTLFAPADFQTKATHMPTLKESLWERGDFGEMSDFERRNYILTSLFKAIPFENNFDIIHISSQRYAHALAKTFSIPCITTLHSRMTKREFLQLKKSGSRTITLTEGYKRKIGADHFVHIGIPIGSIKFSYASGHGLVTVGRLNEQKGIHNAIQIAQMTGKPLTIIGRIGNSPERQRYYKERIHPHLDHSNITLIEKIKNSELIGLIATSEALLFPITETETFGRVTIEALACGTPVVGSRQDPLPEILKDEKVSFLSENTEQLVEKVKNIETFDRHACRKYAEKNFDVSLMANKHIDIYEETLRESSRHNCR